MDYYIKFLRDTQGLSYHVRKTGFSIYFCSSSAHSFLFTFFAYAFPNAIWHFFFLKKIKNHLHISLSKKSPLYHEDAEIFLHNHLHVLFASEVKYTYWESIWAACCAWSRLRNVGRANIPFQKVPSQMLLGKWPSVRDPGRDLMNCWLEMLTRFSCELCLSRCLLKVLNLKY